MPRIETVRVANPAVAGGFMTINLDDLADHHVVWPDQIDGFVLPPPRPVPLDPAVRDLAARLMIGLVSARLELSGEDWSALTDVERFERLRAVEADVGGFLAIRHVRQAGGDATNQGSVPAPVVAKGPRGLWYVMDGETRVSKGFLTEAEALAGGNRMTGVAA